MNLGTFLNFKFSLFAVLLQVFEARVERTYYTLEPSQPELRAVILLHLQYVLCKYEYVHVQCSTHLIHPCHQTDPILYLNSNFYIFLIKH